MCISWGQAFFLVDIIIKKLTTHDSFIAQTLVDVYYTDQSSTIKYINKMHIILLIIQMWKKYVYIILLIIN